MMLSHIEQDPRSTHKDGLVLKRHMCDLRKFSLFSYLFDCHMTTKIKMVL